MERREIVLVEGLLDVHHLRAKGLPAIAAIGGARAQSGLGPRLQRLGFDSIVLAFDNDTAGRDGIARAVEEISRAPAGPAVRVLEPAHLGDAKDPDAFVRKNGIETFRDKVAQAECGITWRALDLTHGVSDLDPAPRRRAALARSGAWLATLPARYSLEQEDAIRLVADRCGYSTTAVERAFRARFWDGEDTRRRVRLAMER